MTDPTPQRNSALDWLIQRLARLVAAATDALESDPADVEAWQQELSRQLARYHAASYLAGSGEATLAGPARAAVLNDLATQLKFLGKFAVEIQNAAEWQRGWNSRAAMYAKSIRVPYERGHTKMLPLPAMPGDGSTTCLVNCDCGWDIIQLDGDENYDCHWRLGEVERHCQICKQRAMDWSPLEVRNGVVQL